MKPEKIADYLSHIRQATEEASVFVEQMTECDFENDLRTQRAVVMNLVIIGEAAARLMDAFPEFISAHPEIPWAGIRGMRNRLAHGYFEINTNLVWKTIQIELPKLLANLSKLP